MHCALPQNSSIVLGHAAGQSRSAEAVKNTHTTAHTLMHRAHRLGSTLTPDQEQHCTHRKDLWVE